MKPVYLILFVAVVVGGCTQDAILHPQDSPQDSDVAEAELIASWDFPDQSRIEFLEIEGEALLVSAVGPSEGGLALLATELETKDPVAIFEHLVGTGTAPARLRELSKRWGPMEVLQSDETTTDARTLRDEEPLDLDYSASTFSSTFCTSVSGWYSYCLTNRKVGDTFNEDTSYMTFVVNVTSGSVRQKLKYYKSGSWHTIYDYTTSAGTTRTMNVMYSSSGSWIPSRDTRAIVGSVSRSTDNYHVAVYGF